MQARYQPPQMSLLRRCVLFATSAVLTACAHESPKESASSTVQAQPASTLTNITFNIRGTPLMMRLEEVRGIVYPEDLDPQPPQRSRGVQILPKVAPPFPTDTTTSGRGFIPLPFPSTDGGMTFLHLPAKPPGTLELRLLAKLKGISLEPGRLFLYPSTGLLQFSGTTRNGQLLQDLIQNPPTNAVAYLKALPNGLKLNDP